MQIQFPITLFNINFSVQRLVSEISIRHVKNMQPHSLLNGVKLHYLQAQSLLLELFYIIFQSLAYFAEGIIYRNKTSFRNSGKMTIKCIKRKCPLKSGHLWYPYIHPIKLWAPNELRLNLKIFIIYAVRCAAKFWYHHHVSNLCVWVPSVIRNLCTSM